MGVVTALVVFLLAESHDRHWAVVENKGYLRLPSRDENRLGNVFCKKVTTTSSLNRTGTGNSTGHLLLASKPL